MRWLSYATFGTFFLFSVQKLRPFFREDFFEDKSHFLLLLLQLRLPTVKFVFVCVCIFVFVYFLSFRVYFVYSYSYLRRICVFPAFSAARSPLLLTSRHLPVNAGDDRWDSPAPFINRLQPAATVFPGVFANFDPVFPYFCHECTAKIVFVPPTLFLFQPEPIKCLKESAEMWKTTKLFYKLSFCLSVPVWFWTPKTCFTLGLECFGHIYSYQNSFESSTLWLLWWSPRPFEWSVHGKSKPL